MLFQIVPEVRVDCGVLDGCSECVDLAAAVAKLVGIEQPTGELCVLLAKALCSRNLLLKTPRVVIYPSDLVLQSINDGKDAMDLILPDGCLRPTNAGFLQPNRTTNSANSMVTPSIAAGKTKNRGNIRVGVTADHVRGSVVGRKGDSQRVGVLVSVGVCYFVLACTGHRCCAVVELRRDIRSRQSRIAEV